MSGGWPLCLENVSEKPFIIPTTSDVLIATFVLYPAISWRLSRTRTVSSTMRLSLKATFVANFFGKTQVEEKLSGIKCLVAYKR